MRIKTGSDTVTSAYTKIYGYERPHVSGYTAYTEISTLESVYRNLRIHRAYTADTCGRLSYAVSGFGQFLKSDSREKRVFSYRGFAARVFGRKPTTCWPTADEAPRRTQEKNLWYPQ